MKYVHLAPSWDTEENLCLCLSFAGACSRALKSRTSGVFFWYTGWKEWIKQWRWDPGVPITCRMTAQTKKGTKCCEREREDKQDFGRQGMAIREQTEKKWKRSAKGRLTPLGWQTHKHKGQRVSATLLPFALWHCTSLWRGTWTHRVCVGRLN